jgi:type IV pilus assembly protein PilN
MRISVNLATRPFVELRPLFARLRLTMVGLALLAVVLGVWLHSLNARAAKAAAEMADIRTRTQMFQQEKLDNEAKMRRPENRGVLERSKFLNEVFAAKSFSWTAVMMDLEKVLPTGVQVTSLEPQIQKDGSVRIRLRVSGDRERAVQLVRNLEGSQRFIAARLAGEAAQTGDSSRTGQQLVAALAGPGTVEFEIFSGYNPLPTVVMARSVVRGISVAESLKIHAQTSPRSRAAAKKAAATKKLTAPVKRGGR